MAVKTIDGFTHINLDEGLMPSTLDPSTKDGTLAAFFSPEQWPMRPPVTKYPVLPIKRRTEKLPDCACLLYVDGEYRFSPKLVFSLTASAVTEAAPVDPALLVEQGWIGD